MKVTETEFLFVDDVSRMFRISPNTLRRKEWRRKSGIPLRKVGKQLCGARTEIERWFQGLDR